MSIFYLPDLGEGLLDAEIHQWYCKTGDTVEADQPLLVVETAKAIVDVTVPYNAKVIKLFAEPGDIVKTGAPLVEFSSEQKVDAGTVVGEIKNSGALLEESFIIGREHNQQSQHFQTTPAVRALAKQLNVDLKKISPTQTNGFISLDDVKAAAALQHQAKYSENLQSTRRSMAKIMQHSHQHIVPVTLFEDADINHWPEDADISINVIHALVKACQQEPALNAWFDGESLTRELHDDINLGLAVDSEEGLFVPVIKAANKLSRAEIRSTINTLKQQVAKRELPPSAFQDATISLSNFGNYAGRYASPIIVAPMVAIIAIGKLRTAVVPVNGAVEIHRILPISLSFDHRALTGGEATRFLGCFIDALQCDNQ